MSSDPSVPPRRAWVSEPDGVEAPPSVGRRGLPVDGPVDRLDRSPGGAGRRSSGNWSDDDLSLAEPAAGRRAFVEPVHGEADPPQPRQPRLEISPTAVSPARAAEVPDRGGSAHVPDSASPAGSSAERASSGHGAQRALPDLRRPAARTPAARRAVPDRRPARHVPLLAAVTVLVLTLVGMGVYVVGRGTATASGSTPTPSATAAPRVVTLAPGAGRPTALKTWLEEKGFTCTQEATRDIEGHLCLLSGPKQTTAYVGGSSAGLGRVTMMTPYDPSEISQEVQDHLLAATLGSPEDVATAKAGLAGGTLEKPATVTIGALTVRGSTGRQLVITTDGWPGVTPPRFGVTPQSLPTLAQQAGYACTQQSGVVECTRSIGQMQLSLSGFTGVDELRYVRLRVTGTDRTVVQQALVAEATTTLSQIGGETLSEAFKIQAANGTAFTFSGSYLLDYYPATPSGNTVRTTLYLSQSCWTGAALTC